MARILIIDDEDVFREDLASLLRLEGYECRTVADGERGLEVARSYRPSVVLCDHIMPGMLGTEVIEHLVSEHPDCVVLVVTAHATVDMAVKAFRLGALDVVLKPIVPAVLLRTLERISEQQRLRTEVGNLRRALVRRTGTLTMVGKSPAMQELQSLVERVAPHRSPVLISGENGTGKELVAQSIHQAGPNSNGPFVAINCSAVTDTLFESELFGHVKGAFTGAEGARKGYFETAAGGTLLFDEVGEVPMSQQAKLLRVLETNEINRVGDSKPIPTSARVLACTNRDLESLMKEELFRSDLFYRLSVVHVRVVPLRDRREDIPLLVEHFLDLFKPQMNLKRVDVDASAMRALMSYHWPGNIRELKNAVERALMLGDGEQIGYEDLPPEIAGQTSADPDDPSADDDLRAATHAFERAHIRRVLRRSGGSRSEAARRLGIDASTLWRKLSTPN